MKIQINKSIILVIAALFFGVFATGCNTMEGFGEDVEQVGDNIEDTAEDAAN